jgi:predicted transcriptional regulator
LSGLQAFVGLIEDADLLKIITPFYNLDFVNRLDVIASKDKEWHLIVTEEVLQRAIMDAEHPNVKALLQGKGQIRVLREDPKLFFVSTGDAIALALEYVRGLLDYSTLLVS